LKIRRQIDIALLNLLKNGSNSPVSTVQNGITKEVGRKR